MTVIEKSTSSLRYAVHACHRVCKVVTVPSFQHSSDGIRKAAVWTLGKLTKVWFEFCAAENKGN
jgi:hypothetical protein